MKKSKISLLALLFFVVDITFAASNQAVIVKPDNLQWLPANGLPGAEVALISGDPEKPGPFIARVKLPANFQIPVHTHSINEYDTVLSGTLYLGTGKNADVNQAQAIPAGAFVMIPAHIQHYAFTKDETILQINGQGPWGMIYKNTQNKS